MSILSLDERPDPDALLAQVTTSETTRNRGRLKVFLGATAGVGKTYAMLEAAQARRREGVDVIIGVVETHGRKETQALVEGLAMLDRRSADHASVTVTEFDIDAALARHPAVILIDELAHTNAPGSRHAKRWQDVEELLNAGIDVYTTLNIQHLESLNDVVARITHVQVRETIPDAVLERADEVELIDLPPDDLLRRLAEGKVYLPEQAQRAGENFFRKGNLIALRQLALRQAAARVDAQMLVYRRAQGVRETWPATERLMVGVGPAPSSEHVVRAAKRMADRLGAEWIAVYVETPASARFDSDDQDRVWETLRLAERLGASTATLAGATTRELLTYAQKRNVTRIVVGKPAHHRWLDRLFPTGLDEIIRDSGDIDVTLVSGERDLEERRRRKRVASESPAMFEIGAAVGMIALTTIIGILLRNRGDVSNIVMLYLLVIGAIAYMFHRAVAIAGSILSVAAFDFFCIPPYLTFATSDVRFLPVFAVMLLASLVISTLTSRLRIQASAARNAQRRTVAMFDLGRDLARTADPRAAMQICRDHLADTFQGDVRILLPDPFGELQVVAPPGQAMSTADIRVARWVFDNARNAGMGTDTLPSTPFLNVPLFAAGKTVGVVAIAGDGVRTLRNPEDLHAFEASANQLADTVVRMQRTVEQYRTQKAIEIASLTSEMAARSTPGTGDAPDGGADRTSIEPAPLLQQCMHDVTSAAAPRRIRLEVDIAPDIPEVFTNRGSMSAVVEALLFNAITQARDGGRVLLSADNVGEALQISVADDGLGIALPDQDRLFSASTGKPGGDSTNPARMSLSDVRSVVQACGGMIWVDSGPGPGCIISFTIPFPSHSHDPR